uniref:Protein bunched, class 2/F/G isoform n=1 Tax=Culex pipiens TaxID=7175 RepID=A0A8D8D1W5_CULPI
MAEHSTVGSTQPNSSTTSSASSKTGGGGLHSNKSLDMTSASSAGGGGGGKSSSKHSNVIHRTTSESLRLGGAAGVGGGGGDSSGGSGTPSASLMNSSSAASINSVSRKAASVAGGGGGKPSSSFMITSVTVGARTSADNGDDSADDLDESHTDDNSRITDFENETPSFSEDTFSKEDVFFAANALGNVPVIPTSSQYGLAIVAPTDRGHGSEGLSDAMHVSVTDAGINIMGHSKEDGKDSHHRNERFKVVKIESTEPFKRGRWVCMDYLDHTTLQASPKESGTSEGGETSTASTIVDSNAIRTQDSGVVLNDNSYGTTGPSEGDNADYHTHLAAASAATNPVVGMLNNESPGQSLNLAQPTTSQQQQQQASHAQTAAAAATVPHSLPQTQLANALAGAQAPQPAAIPPQQPQPQYYPHTMSNLADITQQQPAGGHQHGVTLPTSIQMQPQPQQPSNNPATVLPAAAPAAVATSQEMNIVVSNTQQMSFPSPQQFQQQQQPSQTNSPVVATGGGGNEQDPAAVLSPSSSVAAQPVPTPSQPLDSAPPTTEPLVSASPAATSSPITATAEPSASTNSAPSMAAAVAAAVGSPSTSASSHATIAAAAAAAAATAVTSDHLTESNLLSAVAGVTAAAVAAAGGGDGEGDKTGEDGESLGRIQPVTDPTTTVPSSAPTTTPIPAIPERTLTTSSLQQHLQQNIPLDRSRIPSSSASSVSSVSVNRNNTFTDLALGRTIQDLMRPGVAGGQPTSSTTAAAGGEVLCRTACNLLNNGAHSIATCTTTYPHRCVQDLIKEEMGGGSRTPGTLSQAGSLVNIHIESELQQHAATGGGGGFQSHPNSGRSSPAHTMFHHGGSPPKHLSAIGHSMSIPSSTRVSRAPSPSFLHAAVAEHSSASGTSAVAIDNKIEQAMDLVKSHLMFAVREEVEVLKEKISELMDRINQLEYENNILKQNASQETLSQLTPSGTPSAAQSAQTTAGAAAASVAAALTPLAKSQAAAAASASSAAAAAGTPTVNPNANGSVS